MQNKQNKIKLKEKMLKEKKKNTCIFQIPKAKIFCIVMLRFDFILHCQVEV